MKQRDAGIDILKCLAVLLVVNSHMDDCYPGKLSVLGTGGAFGDALFFFCSGYTLFLGRMDNFFQWYGRRLWRVLPATLICSVILFCVCGEKWWRVAGGWWFVQCILLYYIVLYMIRKWLMNRLWLVFAVVLSVVCGWFFVAFNKQFSIYGGGYFKWSHYFIPMLVGACIGLKRSCCPLRGRWLFVLLIVSIVLWYAGCAITLNYEWLNCLQLLTLPALWMIAILFYCLAENPRVVKFCHYHHAHFFVMLVGGLCLEIYLSHRLLLSNKINYLFPFNVPLLLGAMVVLAYAIRCLVRFVTRALQGQDAFNLHEIVRID